MRTGGLQRLRDGPWSHGRLKSGRPWLLIDHPSSSATCVQCDNSALLRMKFAQPQIFLNIHYFRWPGTLWDFKPARVHMFDALWFRQQGVTVESFRSS